MMRIPIVLLCLAGLTLTACDRKAENKPAPSNNHANTAAQGSAYEPDDATILDDETDDNAGVVMTGYDEDDESEDLDDDLPPDEPGTAWATPIAGIAGLPNFHRVSDGLYRGAQPTSAEGFRRLEKMGIKTVLNLRSLHSDKKLLAGTGLAYESINMKAWHAENEDIVRFLQIVTDPDRQPVFVHCQHGADRTGTMCAVYRIVVQGWDKEEAIRETRYGGFGFHEIWTGLPKYIRKLDIQTIRDKTNLPE